MTVGFVGFGMVGMLKNYLVEEQQIFFENWYG